MSAWADFGLPPVQTDGYGYRVLAGLERTPFDTARPKQRRMNTLNVREFTANVQLTQAQLGNFETAVHSYGTAWFLIDVLTGEEPGAFTAHAVRVAADYRVSALGQNLYRVEMALESGEAGTLPAALML